ERRAAAYVVRQWKAAQITSLRRVEIVPQREIDRAEIENLRAARACAEAIKRAIAWRRNVPVLPILIREPKVIHYSGTQDTGHAQQILIHPVLVRDVVRGKRRNGGCERPAVAIPVMRVADEERMLVVVAVIDPPAQLLARVRRRHDSRESRDRGKVGLHDVDAELIRVFEVEEEVELVLFDRAAEYEPALPSGEEGIVGNRGSTKARIGRHIVIAEIEISGAVKIVASSSSHDVDCAEGRDSCREVEVRARKLKLLPDLLRKVLPGAAFDRIADVAAVNRDGRVRGRAAQYGDVELRVELSRIAGIHGHAGFQLGQVQKAAPVERQVVNLLPRDDALHGV